MRRTDILLSPAFLLGLLVLLANDFIFKYQFHNALTGKLSDIAGLFIFPLFIAAVLRRHSKHVFVGVALFFICWKSPLSNGLLELMSSVSGLSFGRVVDYTDLLCLPVLILSYLYLKSDYLQLQVSRTLIMVVSAFAFMATSQRKPISYQERHLREEGYQVLISKVGHVLPSGRLQFCLSNDARFETYDSYGDTMLIFLKKDSADRAPLVFEFCYLKNGDARLTKLLAKGIVPDENKMFGLLNNEITKSQLAFEKLQAQKAKVNMLLKLVAKYQRDRSDDREIFLIDTLLNYATPEFISEHQLYEVKADILIAHYNSAYKEEIMTLFDRQDSLDHRYGRSQYSVNRYGKRLDFYELIKKDSLEKADQKYRKSPDR